MNKNVKQKGNQMNKNMKKKGKQMNKIKQKFSYSIIEIQVASQTDSKLGTCCITLEFVSKLGNGRSMNF